ncbi:MAG: protein-L-isoaspartate(D-aspartate) O-methyltransferase [Bacteroidales bacterium]|nr:protein-L-isoaspartate(D-aspartate) O-methyltransferase [Bacteroidales bacterium]
MIDTTVHKGQRLKLVESLRQKGISSEKVLEAINAIPRHFFFHLTGMQNHAYQDKAFPIGSGQTISQPYTVAFQTQLLDIQPREKILEIGTGSGYQAAVISKLGAKVYTIERQKNLYNSTKKLLETLHLTNISLFFGDGFKGLPTFAPFDKIIITAAAPEIPVTLINQLKIDGYIVIPLNNGASQTMLRIKKINETEFLKETFGDFSFVPMLTGTAND